MAAAPIQVAARMLLMVVGEVHRQGFDPTPLFARTGCDPAWLDDSELMLPFEYMDAFTRQGVEITKDPDFGLHVAENLRPEMVGLHTYLASTSATLREALGRVFRYMGLVSNLMKYTLLEEGDRAQLIIEGPPELPVQTFQFNVAVNHCFVRVLVDADWRVDEASFAHQAPAGPGEYERIFQAPVHFSRPWNGLRFARALLDAPMRNRDDRLCLALEKVARATLEAIAPSDHIGERARRAVLELPSDAPVRLETVARRMGMSARTLQRRLGQARTSLRQIVDDVRFERARGYLSMEGLSTAEVGFLVGYAEPAAFHRAFVRWSGQTPQGFRKAGGRS